MQKSRGASMLIAFEGTDGSGLSTQSKLLAEWLESEGYTVYLTKEPTTGEIGKLIRRVLRKEIEVSDATLALLFAADRAWHTKIIVERIEKGEIVISDRYRLSSYAYQSLTLDLEWVVMINRYSITPDLTFVIETPPEVSLERIKQRNNGIELFEELEKLEKISRNFRKVAEGNVVFIDGNRSIEEVFGEVKGFM
ncbi:MAG: dTMP kinase [Candidatus Syntrophoarchaeum sp.]|nr:dTMP kinase [Candidatus Syntrophoarchaeum sp.]